MHRAQMTPVRIQCLLGQLLREPASVEGSQCRQCCLVMHGFDTS